MSFEENLVQTHPISHDRRGNLSINLKRLIFYLVFFLVFCFSGILSMLMLMRGGFQYRMGLISFLVIPLLILYGLKVNKITLTYVALTGVIFLSGYLNNTPIFDILTFMRILVFSYLIIRLVELYLNPENISKVIKLCVAIAMLQLPIIGLQRMFYNQMPLPIKQKSIFIDFDFGTFNLNSDAAMAFFLILLVIFLLFDEKRNYIIRYKWPVIFWLTLTLIIQNSRISRLIIILVWGIYFLTHLKPKNIIYLFIISILIVGVLFASGTFDELLTEITNTIENAISLDPIRTEEFLTGNYGRSAALNYYLNNDILWFGDGPSKYFNAFSRTRLRGNTGHVFTFYSEVGLMGLVGSILIFFSIAFRTRSTRMRISWVSILAFISVTILSFTNQVLNNIGVVLIYCIIVNTYLIKPREIPAN